MSNRMEKEMIVNNRFQQNLSADIWIVDVNCLTKKSEFYFYEWGRREQATLYQKVSILFAVSQSYSHSQF